MSDDGKPLQPEHLFKRIAWQNILAVSGAIEQFITWTITGIAAIVGLIISNVNSVSNIISLEDLRIAIILFTVGVAVSNGLKTTDKIDNFFKSDEGKSLLQNISFDFIRMEQELSSPFYWPLSTVIRKSFVKGKTDYLSGDKFLIKMFCIQFYANLFHILFAIAALITIAWSL